MSLFQLRYLQTLNSISAENNSTIIFPVPIDVLSEFMPHSPASNYQSTGFKKNCKIVIDATFKFEFKLVSSLWLKTTLYVTFSIVFLVSPGGLVTPPSSSPMVLNNVSNKPTEDSIKFLLKTGGEKNILPV